MMDVFEAIKSRRSVRKFLDIPVEAEKLGNMLELAKFAPSAGNVQDWKFILVTDAEMRQEVGSACLEQYWVGAAPLLIVVCSDPAKATRFYPELGQRYSLQNVATAIQNMMLVANAQGLATCWVGAFEDARLRRILSIPDSILIHAVLPVGYADEKVPAPKRLEIENFTYNGKWGNRVEDLAAYMEWYGEHVQKAVKQAKKLVSEFARRIQR